MAGQARLGSVRRVTFRRGLAGTVGRGGMGKDGPATVRQARPGSSWMGALALARIGWARYGPFWQAWQSVFGSVHARNVLAGLVVLGEVR